MRTAHDWNRLSSDQSIISYSTEARASTAIFFRSFSQNYFSFINKTFGIENFRILCTSIYSILEATISLLHNMSKIKLVRFLELRLFEFPLSKRELLYLVHNPIKNKGRYLSH